MSVMLDPELSAVDARSYFVRGRNALLTRANLGPLYLDYYLHLMQAKIQHEAVLDGMLKDALAGLVLHLSSRPQDEGCAWTINVANPLVNFFVTGSTRPGRVTGRLFTEEVRNSGTNLFIAQTTRPNQKPRQSMIDFLGDDMLAAIETFYTQSEQRLTRIFRLPDEDFVQISAEPDCDEEWLNALTVEELPTLDQREHLTPLEQRVYVFECGCTMERLFPVLARMPEVDIDYVFAEGPATIHCPRCGLVYRPSREMFEEWRVQQ